MSIFSALKQSLGIVSIETELPHVFQFENVIPTQLCDDAAKYVLEAKASAPYRAEELIPWNDDDTIPWQHCAIQPLKANVYAYRLLLTQIASHCYKEILYPTFTDFVLWRPGRAQAEHKDNGYEFPKDDNLSMRKITSVTYLNDDFEGGETFIRGADDMYHVNTPKKGSVLFFASDDRCPHGVLQVKSGYRITLPIWFTDIPAHCERESGWVYGT